MFFKYRNRAFLRLKDPNTLSVSLNFPSFLNGQYLISKVENNQECLKKQVDNPERNIKSTRAFKGTAKLTNAGHEGPLMHSTVRVINRFLQVLHRYKCARDGNSRV